MWRSKTNFILAIYRRAHRLRFTLAGLLALHHQADHAGLNPGHQCRWQAAPGLDPPHPTLQRMSLTSKALDREGGRLAWRPKVDQKRHKVKGKDQTKGQLPPRGNEEDLHQRHVPHGFLQKSDLALAVTARSQRRRGGRAVCTRASGQRAVLSDSSSESLFSAAECRRTCSRGLRRSVEPSSTWMEGTSKWTRSGRWQRGG